MKTPKLLTLAVAAYLIAAGPSPIQCAAQERIDISSYKKLNAAASEASAECQNSDFSQDELAWKLGDGFKVEPGIGLNGTPGLSYERNDPASYSLCTQGGIMLKPGKTYRFGAWVKAESLKGMDGACNCVALEFYKNGNFAGGIYPAGVKASDKDWTYIGGEFLFAQDFECEGRLTFYLQKRMTGKIFFDNAKLECFDANAWAIHLLYPKMSSVFVEDGAASCKIAKIGEAGQDTELAYYAELKRNGAIIGSSAAAKGAESVAVFNFGKRLTPGNAELCVRVLNKGKKEILAERTLPVTVEQKAKALARGSFIDAKGRLILNGKPFMPIGLYTSGAERDEIKKLAASPFNCVVPYGSVGLKFSGTQKKGIEATTEVLDELERNRIKIIFSLKDVFDGYPKADRTWRLYGAKSEEESVKALVEQLKSHPALLAWYVCDELGGSWISRLEKRRSLVNSLDRKHPTWAVYFNPMDLPLFASTCDIMGVDPYPITSPRNHEMSKVATLMDSANRASGTPSGNALWAVPQFFSQANYDPLAKKDRQFRLKNFADPTEDEMRAMCILMAIKGAKGFIGYSFFDLFSRGAEPDAAKRWPEVCRVGETLKELEPFIMSDENGPELKVEVKTGAVFAKAFSDGHGKVKALVAGIGPGKSEAIIRLPDGLKLSSKSGKTKLAEPGCLVFQGEGICSDILE